MNGGMVPGTLPGEPQSTHRYKPMKINRDTIKGAILGAILFLCIAAASTTIYHGTFVGTHSGLGTGLTNSSGVGYATTTGSITPAQLPVGLSTSNYVGVFSGTGSSLTNLGAANISGVVATAHTAESWTQATNASAGTAAVGWIVFTNATGSYRIQLWQ